MATSMITKTTVLVALLSAFLAAPAIYNADLVRTFKVMGVFRNPTNTAIPDSSSLVVIDDTTHCEDLHYHAPSNLLFTACEGNQETRFSWFPPLANFDDPSVTLKSRGSIHVIDPNTKKAQRLEMQDFEGAFVTHGIDVISDPDKPLGQAVYIFAVNHVPNPQYYGDTLSAPLPTSGDNTKCRSRIEIFHHDVGTTTVKHIRSVWDPLIRTPNDILVLTPTSFLVTNDHIYREGLTRTVEDVYFGARWTDTIHVSLDDLGSTTNDTDSVKATVALENMHNNNGLGHGKTPQEVLVVECVSGILNIGHVNCADDETTEGTRIVIEESVKFDSTIDNPSYFDDPFADRTYDGSSYLAPGLGRAVDLQKTIRDPSGKEPVMVWSAKIAPSSNGIGSEWQTRLLFEDDGSRIRSASAAVMVAIDPAEEGGRRRAWLFVTGFVSRNVIAVKVDV